jgi:serine/threonine kinase 16
MHQKGYAHRCVCTIVLSSALSCPLLLIHPHSQFPHPTQLHSRCLCINAIYSLSSSSSPSHLTLDCRDIKPHNVLLSAPPSSRQFGRAVLTDLGSVCASRCTVQTRQEGLVLEEEAALKSSAAYRAPELTSVRPPVRICEGADVWSLGCTMFSLAFGRSPFEDGGGVQRLGILNGRYQFPLNNSMRDCKYSSQYVQLVNDMLQLEPSSR